VVPVPWQKGHTGPKGSTVARGQLGTTEETISWIHVSPGSADTLVSRGKIRNYYSTVYSLSNISAEKDY